MPPPETGCGEGAAPQSTQDVKQQLARYFYYFGASRLQFGDPTALQSAEAEQKVGAQLSDGAAAGKGQPRAQRWVSAGRSSSLPARLWSAASESLAVFRSQFRASPLERSHHAKETAAPSTPGSVRRARER